MAAPRNISLILDGVESFSAVPLWAWQANPMTLACTRKASLSLLDGVAAIVAEIHATAAPGGAASLASAEVAAADDPLFDFDTLAMSFGIGAGNASAIRYLFITARDAGGVELQTLYARRINILASGYSGIAPAVVPGASCVRLVSVTPDDDGMHTFTASGKTWRQVLPDFSDA